MGDVVGGSGLGEAVVDDLVGGSSGAQVVVLFKVWGNEIRVRWPYVIAKRAPKNK